METLARWQFASVMKEWRLNLIETLSNFRLLVHSIFRLPLDETLQPKRKLKRIGRELPQSRPFDRSDTVKYHNCVTNFRYLQNRDQDVRSASDKPAQNPRADLRLLYDNEPVARYRSFLQVDKDA